MIDYHELISGEIEETVKRRMYEDISDKINKLNDFLLMDNLSFIETLLDRNIPLSALTKLNIDKYKENVGKLTKENYKFPSFINLGELKNWHETPSKIIGGKVFNTTAPLLIPIENSSIGFIQNAKFKDSIINIMETTVLKMISSLPTALTRVSIIDKTGSGQNFPNLIRLHGKITSDKILSEDYEIESELSLLKNSISAITSSITVSGFESIEDYNNNAAEIAQPYRIVAISNFPLGFNKKSAESLLSIIESGYKAGIYVVMSFAVDMKHGLSQPISSLTLNDFLKKMISFEFLDKPHEYVTKSYIKQNVNLISIPYSNESNIKKLINNDFKVVFENNNKSIYDSILSEINNNIADIDIRPIIDIKKTLPSEFWTGNASEGVSIPFAKNGIENIYLSLGVNQYGESEGTYHGLIGGSTGSGKTVMLHDIILHGSMKYSVEELSFWLLDYKEGTEFATYANFPHIDILSMESEVEFGQEVLANALAEIERRGVLFKNKNVSNLKEYNKIVPKEERLKRIIILIDEFHELFPKNIRVTTRTNDLINKILRLGRSFGFNLLLSTQTLKGVDMDAQLMSNLPLRIALKMDKKDISKMFDENNSAVEDLSAQGEGIYNKKFGSSIANVKFQSYLALTDSITYIKNLVLSKIKDNYSEEEIKRINEKRFIYNGEQEGQIIKNKLYQEMIGKKEKFPYMSFFIGEYAGLTKEHAKFAFDREYAENMIIAGQSINRVANIYLYMIKQLLNNEKDCHVVLNNFHKKSSSLFAEIKHENFRLTGNRGHSESVNFIWNELEKRRKLSEEEIDLLPRIVNMIFFPEGSTEFNSNINSKDSSLFKLQKIINEGSELGIHVVLFVSNTNTLASLELTRDIDKFKKRIGTGEGNFEKIFGEKSSNIIQSKSKYVMVGLDTDSRKGLFKFKDYGDIENV